MNLSKFSQSDDWRFRLAIRGRPRLPNDAFQEGDLLYRGFCRGDLDDNGQIGVQSLRFPDLSCNWGRFSLPEDVVHRRGGHDTDGCYSFTVAVARFESIATPVHDPIATEGEENYAHVEVRLLQGGESVLTVPPKERKGSGKLAKAKRLKWREHLVRNLHVEFDATA